MSTRYRSQFTFVPNAPVLRSVAPLEVFAIDMHHLRDLFDKDMKCSKGLHHPWIMLTEERGQLECKIVCGCGTAFLRVLAYFRYNKAHTDDFQPVCLLLTRDALRGLGSCIRQTCGYVPIIQINTTHLVIKCGHHDGCKMVKIPFFGIISLPH